MVEGFEPVNDLERAMLAALVDPEAMPSFLDALSTSELIVPLYRPADEKVDPRVFNMVEVDGQEGVAVYTSIVQMAYAAPEGGPCVQMTGRRLAEDWDGHTPLLINPGGTLGLALDPQTVEGLSAERSSLR